MKEIYVIIYTSKTIAKKIIKQDEYHSDQFNHQMFNIKDYDCPSIDIYEEDNYYTFTLYEDGVNFASKVAYEILKYAGGKAYCTSGYNETTYKYKYTYQNDKICVENYTEKQAKQKSLQLASQFTELNDYLNDYVTLSDDEDCETKLYQLFESHNADYSNTDDLNEIITNPDLLLLEWTFLEDYLQIMKIAKNKSPINNQPLIFTHEYIYEEEAPKKTGFFASLFEKKKSSEIEPSWQEKKFVQEANLWGLSKEEKQHAKQERTSPADFIEAEERDDDELIDDD